MNSALSARERASRAGLPSKATSSQPQLIMGAADTAARVIIAPGVVVDRCGFTYRSMLLTQLLQLSDTIFRGWMGGKEAAFTTTSRAPTDPVQRVDQNIFGIAGSPQDFDAMAVRSI